MNFYFSSLGPGSSSYNVKRWQQPRVLVTSQPARLEDRGFNLSLPPCEAINERRSRNPDKHAPAWKSILHPLHPEERLIIRPGLTSSQSVKDSSYLVRQGLFPQLEARLSVYKDSSLLIRNLQRGTSPLKTSNKLERQLNVSRCQLSFANTFLLSEELEGYAGFHTRKGLSFQSFALRLERLRGFDSRRSQIQTTVVNPLPLTLSPHVSLPILQSFHQPKNSPPPPQSTEQHLHFIPSAPLGSLASHVLVTPLVRRIELPGREVTDIRLSLGFDSPSTHNTFTLKQPDSTQNLFVPLQPKTNSCFCSGVNSAGAMLGYHKASDQSYRLLGCFIMSSPMMRHLVGRQLVDVACCSVSLEDLCSTSLGNAYCWLLAGWDITSRPKHSQIVATAGWGTTSMLLSKAGSHHRIQVTHEIGVRVGGDGTYTGLSSVTFCYWSCASRHQAKDHRSYLYSKHGAVVRGPRGGGHDGLRVAKGWAEFLSVDSSYRGSFVLNREVGCQEAGGSSRKLTGSSWVSQSVACTCWITKSELSDKRCNFLSVQRSAQGVASLRFLPLHAWREDVAVLNRCIPQPLKDVTEQVFHRVYSVLNSWDTVEQVLGDLYATWKEISGLMVVAFGNHHSLSVCYVFHPTIASLSLVSRLFSAVAGHDRSHSLACILCRLDIHAGRLGRRHRFFLVPELLSLAEMGGDGYSAAGGNGWVNHPGLEGVLGHLEVYRDNGFMPCHAMSVMSFHPANFTWWGGAALLLHLTLEEVPEGNIVYFDETNLQDDPGSHKMLFKPVDDGSLLPPYVVYKSEQLWDTWAIGGPPVCFTDRFHKIMEPWARMREGKEILIRDNLSSHCSVEVLTRVLKYLPSSTLDPSTLEQVSQIVVDMLQVMQTPHVRAERQTRRRVSVIPGQCSATNTSQTQSLACSSGTCNNRRKRFHSQLVSSPDASEDENVMTVQQTDESNVQHPSSSSNESRCAEPSSLPVPAMNQGHGEQLSDQGRVITTGVLGVRLALNMVNGVFLLLPSAWESSLVEQGICLLNMLHIADCLDDINTERSTPPPPPPPFARGSSPCKKSVSVIIIGGDLDRWLRVSQAAAIDFEICCPKQQRKAINYFMSEGDTEEANRPCNDGSGGGRLAPAHQLLTTDRQLPSPEDLGLIDRCDFTKVHKIFFVFTLWGKKLHLHNPTEYHGGNEVAVREAGKVLVFLTCHVLAAKKQVFTVTNTNFTGGCGGEAASALTSHQCEPGSIPGRITPRFVHVGIGPHDAVAGTGFLWWTYADLKRSAHTTPNSLLSESIYNETAFLTYSIIATVITVSTSDFICTILVCCCIEIHQLFVEMD
ncbi:hypothetical protein PR048_033015 [Dryococelus australis]|uniref:DDE-1 domain-containing protein n=1 Tax=Dryococelus australis TaxID=614101 RepID=A0ABQ9G806_9NEOP|nr:hypothetical protein PR048_033015 [Dryococelus australis]